MLLIYGLAVLALNILTGGSGQFSLGQSAFYAIGAYTSAILMEHFNVDYALTLPIAGIICFAAGFLFGQPALRLSGVYLALATFALATAMPQLLKLGYFEHWTGGVQGLVVTKPDAPDLLESALKVVHLKMSQDMWLYYFTLAITVAIYLWSVNLLRSRSGRAFMAIRDNEIAASSMGVNARSTRRWRSASPRGSPASPAASGPSRCNSWRPTATPSPLRSRCSSEWWSAASAGFRIVRRRRLHHLRAEHLGEHLQGPLRRRLRRAAVPRDLPGAARREASCHRRPTAGGQIPQVTQGEKDNNAFVQTSCCRGCGGTLRPDFVDRARAEEIRHRRQRHRDQDRQHHALQRPGVGLRRDRQDGKGLFQQDQRRGRHQRPQDQLHLL